MQWQIRKISDEAYFSSGDIFGGLESPLDRNKELIVSNSFIKACFSTNLHHHLITDGGGEIDDEKQAIFDTGSAFHCYVLEHDEFDDRYHVSDYADASKQTVRIGSNEFRFIESAYLNIKSKYKDAVNGEYVELAIFGEIDSVPVKCKIDKLNIKKTGSRYDHVEILDLKGVYFDPFKQKRSPNGERWKLRKLLSDNDYDLQFYFYKTMVEKWLESINQYCDVSFSLLVASKETYQCQKFRLGSEMYETGRQKFDSTWPDIRDFVMFGKDRLIDEEVL